MEQEEIKQQTSISVLVGKEGNQQSFEIPIYYDSEEKKRCKIKYFENLMDLFDENENREIQVEECNPKTFQWVIDYMKAHDWNPPLPETPVKSGTLAENICQIDQKLLKDLNYKDTNTNEDKNPTHLKNLYAAAKYLQIEELSTLILVRIATEFYFGTSLESYQNIQKKHDIQTDLTIKEEQRIQEWYGFCQDDE